MAASDARAALPALLSRVEQGEEITITRHGRPVAVLVRPQALLRRRAGEALASADVVHELLAQASATALPEEPGLTQRRAEQLVQEIAAGRAAR